MDRFDPTWPQHWPDLGSTLGSKGPTSAQLGPIGSHFGPTWLQDGATWPLAPIWEQLCPKLRSIRLQKGARFHWYFPLFLLSIPMLCLHWPQLGVKLLPRVPSCGMLELTWISMRITWLQFGIHLCCFGPNFSPTWPIFANFTQLGPKLGQVGVLWGSLGPSWAQPEPILPTQCATLKARIFTAISGFVRGHVAHIGLVLCPTSAPDAPVAHAKPSLCRNVPKLRHVEARPKLGPSWSQVARVRRKLRPSWAQVRSCSAQVKAKDGQV